MLTYLKYVSHNYRRRKKVVDSNFLGIWSTKIKKQKLNNLDYEVINHHWIDVNLMENDLKVNKFYEELLEILSKT